MLRKIGLAGIMGMKLAGKFGKGSVKNPPLLSNTHIKQWFITNNEH